MITSFCAFSGHSCIVGRSSSKCNISISLIQIFFYLTVSALPLEHFLSLSTVVFTLVSQLMWTWGGGVKFVGVKSLLIWKKEQKSKNAYLKFWEYLIHVVFWFFFPLFSHFVPFKVISLWQPSWIRLTPNTHPL